MKNLDDIPPIPNSTPDPRHNEESEGDKSVKAEEGWGELDRLLDLENIPESPEDPFFYNPFE